MYVIPRDSPGKAKANMYVANEARSGLASGKLTPVHLMLTVWLYLLSPPKQLSVRRLLLVNGKDSQRTNNCYLQKNK